MAIETEPPPASDAAILSRLFGVESDHLTAEGAQALLTIRFEQRDLDRIHELVTKNQDERLTAAQRIELENYRRVSFLVDLVHAKARQALKTPLIAAGLFEDRREP